MTQSSPNPPPAKPVRKWLRRSIWIGAILSGALVALFLALVLALPLIAKPIIRAKLQSMISDNLNAQLQIGSLAYSFPYGVDVHDASLVAKDDDGSPVELLRIPSLHLALAKLPFGDGPLVIRELTLAEPAIHLINTPTGFVGQRTLVRPEIKPEEAHRRLSEMFELRLFLLQGAQIVYQDRTKPKTVPFVWRQIDAKLTTHPETNPIYAYDFSAGNASLAKLTASGKFNIDDLDLTSLFNMTVHVDPAQKESPAPPVVQQLAIDNGIVGTLTIAGNAHVPMMNYAASTFDTTIELADGKARPAGFDQDLDDVTLKMRLSSSPIDETQSLLATSLKLNATTNPAQRPVLYAWIQKITGHMGKNVLALSRGDLMVDWSAGHWSIPAIKLGVNLAIDKSSLPAQFRAAAQRAGLVGKIDMLVQGEGSLLPDATGARPYHLDVHAQSPKLTLTDRHLVATDVACDVLLDPQAIRLLDDGAKHHGLVATAYGGSIKADGQLTLATPMQYQLNTHVANLDLGPLAKAWTANEPKPLKLTGKAAAQAHVNGAIPTAGESPLQSIAGNGDVEIKGGEFYELPVLADILKVVSPHSKAGTVGQAAAVFTIANQNVHFQKLAVGAPILGVTGSGDVGFDGKLKLEATAAPLSDWKDQLSKSGIPLIGDLVGNIAGQAQNILNSATKNLIVAFKIDGTIANPTITPVPAPALTENGVDLFKSMMKGSEDLLDHMRGNGQRP